MKHDTRIIPKGVPSRKYNSSKYIQYVDEFLESEEKSAEVIRDYCSSKAIRVGLKRAIDKFHPGMCDAVIRGESVFLVRLVMLVVVIAPVSFN
jgi:hypothetical protein